MKFNIRAIIRFSALFFFSLLVGMVPLVLFYVGTREPGINLQSALGDSWTFESFIRLFAGLNSPEIRFRESLYRSIAYSSIVAFGVTFTAFFYTNWIAGWSKKSAVGMSFTLLTLTLLPQTYLIMPILVAKQGLPRYLDPLIIIAVIALGVLPLSAWAFHMMSGQKITNLQEHCALDRLGMLQSLMKIVGEIRINLIIVFLLAWAIAWGNYLVPFSLGSRNSYTAVVQIATFTTNLGRDWAMICASGFIVSIPGVLIGLIFGGVTLWSFLQRRV